MADYPHNFVYHVGDKVLSWDGLPDAAEYEIDYALASDPSSWQVAYNGGNQTDCSFIHQPSIYIIKGKCRGKDGVWGIYSPLEQIFVP